MDKHDSGRFSGRTLGLAAVALLAVSGLAQAGKTAPAQDTKLEASASVLDQAINDIRSEQRKAMQQAARVALASLRSETQTALSQGATGSASASVHARP